MSFRFCICYGLFLRLSFSLAVKNYPGAITFWVGEPSLSKVKFQQFSGHPLPGERREFIDEIFEMACGGSVRYERVGLDITRRGDFHHYRCAWRCRDLGAGDQ